MTTTAITEKMIAAVLVFFIRATISPQGGYFLIPVLSLSLPARYPALCLSPAR